MCFGGAIWPLFLCLTDCSFRVSQIADFQGSELSATPSTLSYLKIVNVPEVRVTFIGLENRDPQQNRPGTAVELLDMSGAISQVYSVPCYAVKTNVHFP